MIGDQRTHSNALQAIQKIGEAVRRGDTLGQMAQLLLDEAHRTIGAQAGIVCRRQAAGTIDILAQYSGSIAGNGVDSEASLLALVAPLLSGELTTKKEDLLAAKLDSEDSHIRSSIEVPLVGSAGKAIGAICFADSRPGMFSDADRQLLNSLAPWIADTMERAEATPSKHLAAVTGSEWLGSLAHDLRNPLQRICMVSELLSEGLDESQQSLMTKLSRATTSLESQITQLEDVVAIQKGSLHLEILEADLASLMRRVVEAAREQARSTGAGLRGPQQDQRTTLAMDSTRMEQALGVLLDRVIAASPGSSIAVSCRDGEHAVHLELAIMTPSAVPVALSRLLTRSTDLELIIARGIVRLHGGKMNVMPTATTMLTISVEWPHA